MSCWGWAAPLLCCWPPWWRRCRSCKAAGPADDPRSGSRWTSASAPLAPSPLRAPADHAPDGSTPEVRRTTVYKTPLWLGFSAFRSTFLTCFLYLVSLKFPSDRGQGYGVPLHLCQLAVLNHDLHIIRGRQRHCRAKRNKETVRKDLLSSQKIKDDQNMKLWKFSKAPEKLNVKQPRLNPHKIWLPVTGKHY